MGEHARRVQGRLRNALADTYPNLDWQTERTVAGTPVDVAGEGDALLVLVELEWRRADPANNTVKLFRHLAEETVDAETVVLTQVFTTYYDLASGGVSTKRENAEFVGSRVAATFDHVEYRSVTLPLDPPKRGGELPAGWRERVDETAAELP